MGHSGSNGSILFRSPKTGRGLFRVEVYLLSLFGVGLRLQTATILFVAASALAWVLGYFLGRGQDKLRTGGPGLWLGLAVTVVTMIERPWYGRAVDTFYHLAAVRSHPKSFVEHLLKIHPAQAADTCFQPTSRQPTNRSVRSRG